MTTCVKIQGKRRQLCAGDLDRLITFMNRAITTPTDVDYTTTFTDTTIAMAMIQSVNGTTIFDQTNQERTVSDIFYTRYIEGITAQTWILFEGNHYDILKPEDLDRRHEWLKIYTNMRGPSTNANNSY